jgi:hypothetical protein
MNYARIALAKASEDVDPAAYMESGAIIGTKFNAKLVLFDKFTSASPSEGTAREVSGETVPVFNIHDEEIKADELLIIGQTIDETWIVECKY